MEITPTDKLRFFAENGSGPYTCFFCNESVYAPWNKPKLPRRLKLFVHHHHVIDQLVASHGGCHSSHHHRGKKMSEAARKKMSISQCQRQSAPLSTRRKISKNTRHQWQDPIIRVKMIEDLERAWEKRSGNGQKVL